MVRAGRALLEALLDLAKIDAELDELNQRREEQKRKLAAAQQQLNQAKARLEDAKRRKKEKAKRAYHIEHEMKQVETELRQVRERLLNAKTNEEFRLLKEEEQKLQEKISRMEDEALGVLDEEDRMEAEVGKFEDAVEEAEARLKICNAETEKELEKIRRDEAFVAEKRRQVAEMVPPHVLERYERVRKKVGGSPLAEVDPVQQVCRGCQMQVTLQDIVEIRRGDKLVFCRYCSRILYIPEEQLSTDGD